MNCTKCGQELAEGISFCPKCGNALNGEEKCKYYSKEQIDKAAEDKDTAVLWKAIDAGFVYAEYKYEQYIFGKLEKLKKMSCKTTYQEMMSEASAHEKAGSLFARYICAYTQFIVCAPTSDYVRSRNSSLSTIARAELERLFETTQPSASYRAAEFYLDGKYKFTVNIEKGFKALKRSADAGHPTAMLRMAEIYHNGIEGVKKSKKKENKYRQQADFFGASTIQEGKEDLILQIKELYFTDELNVTLEQSNDSNDDPQAAVQHCFEMIEQVKKEKAERIENAVKEAKAARPKQAPAEQVSEPAKTNTPVSETKGTEYLKTDPTEGFFDYAKELEIMKNEYSFPNNYVPVDVLNELLAKCNKMPEPGNQRYNADDIPEPGIDLVRAAKHQTQEQATEPTVSVTPVQAEAPVKAPFQAVQTVPETVVQSAESTKAPVQDNTASGPDIQTNDNTQAVVQQPQQTVKVSPVTSPSSVPKKSKAGTVIRWILSVVIILFGLLLMIGGAVSGALIVLSGLFMCPKLLKKLPTSASVTLSIITMIIGFIII